MITATISKTPETLTLRLSGHAGAAEMGKDIVCSAASILAYIAVQEAHNLHARHQLAEPPAIRENPGDLEVVIKPINKVSYDDALHTFYVLRIGYSLLEHKYPQYVELKLF